MDIMVIFGSESDLPVGEEVRKIFDKLGVKFEMRIASAHRTPDRVYELIKKAEDQGAKAIIAGAGMSAHLAGVVASKTILPVIGIPMDAGPLHGIDSLLSTVNMPGGIPVATVSLGKAGGKNAALLACSIIALGNEKVSKALKDYRREMTAKVYEADRLLGVNNEE